jgi:proteasome assembly chaperone (PAC2) family protein
MSELNVSYRPELRNPVLVAAFRGWNDGGQGASLAAGYLAKVWDAQRFAEIDAENFYDFQATRPMVTLEDGLTRKLEWPENAFFHAHVPGTDRDAVILLGTEPNLRWRTYADVPHTRPSPVTASATDERLVEELGLEPSRYEGPTGIVGILLDAARNASITSLSLWAAVPHYVSLAPSPRAALALVSRFGELMSLDVEIDELETAADEYSEQVSEAVSTDADTAAYVEELERRVDLLSAEEELPSGDSLAAELTRFLKERDEQEERDDGPEGPAS